MSTNFKIIPILLGITCISLLSGCYKVTTLRLNDGEEITGAVSLNTDLMPKFLANCSTSGCHNSGGIHPDLSAGNAYASLINGNYVNTGSPESSELYLWLTGKKAVAMPVGANNNPFNINQYVLAWIKQGALNN